MQSLRTRILASHALVVVLSLLLAGTFSLLLLVRYQRQATLARRQALAVTVVDDLLEMVGEERLGAQLPMEVLRNLRQQAAALGGRFLVTDAEGRVLADTADEDLVGQRVRLPAGAQRREWRRLRLADGALYYLAGIPLQRVSAQEAGAQPQRYLILAVRAEEIGQTGRQMLALLAVAGVLALAVSLVVAYLLSRSIARPVRALTQATQAMTQGHYEQSVAAEGEDELAELARSFNAMTQQLERARRMEQEFMANITHDLRTPLTSIRGFAQALLDGAVEDEEGYRQAAGIIHEEAERMGRLIDDLLELARLEAGVAELRRERLEAGLWLGGLKESFRARTQAAGLALQWLVAGPLPPIQADPHRLEQAIANLVDNAIKYTPASGTVTFKAVGMHVRHGQVEPPVEGELVVRPRRLAPGSWLALQVTDTGPGIAPEDLGRVFERFYRADRARAKAAGSGLGLSIVREIVVAHGGAIAVRSAPGQGATFTILLPA